MKKHTLLIQLIIWFISILFLVFSIYQLHGDAKVINYAGIVRGGTQRLIKKEMYHESDDALLEHIDQILEELQTGKGPDHLVRLADDQFQNNLKEMSSIWEDMKTEIMLVRNGKDPTELFTMSEGYFDLANATVSAAESISTKKLTRSLIMVGLYMILSTLFLMTQNRRRRKEMKILFYTDHLTGIGNMPAFQEAIVPYIGNGHSYAIIHMDIDGFKSMNDLYGYPYGDEILKTIATCLKENYPVVAHIEADNFMILAYPEEHFEEKLRTLLNETIRRNLSENISKALTYSMGIYISAPQEDALIADLIDKAEIAHKQCRGKKASITWYDETFVKRIQKESRIEKSLGIAIQEKELLLYLQPKFSLKDDQLIGAEALVRWKSSAFPFMMPDEFIPLFEKNGTIYQLDFYMLEQVCRFIQDHLLQSSNLSISINFSRITLHLDNFYQIFHQIIQAFDIPAHMIELEMTESAFQGISEPVIAVLRQLKQEGFIISIDDFGSGFSSLNMLTSLPIDCIKIDKNFLVVGELTKEHQELITSIIQMAHLLHLEVLCEGVETKQHVELLKQAHCDYAQGYYYDKALYFDDFLKQYLMK